MTSSAITTNNSNTGLRNNQRMHSEAVSKYDLTAYAHNDTILYFTKERQVLATQGDICKLALKDEGTVRGFIRRKRDVGIVYQTKSFEGKLLQGAGMLMDVLLEFRPDMHQQISDFGVSEALAQACGMPAVDRKVAGVSEPLDLPETYEEAMLMLLAKHKLETNVKSYTENKPVIASFLATAKAGLGDEPSYGYITAQEMLANNGYPLDTKIIRMLNRLLLGICAEHHIATKPKQGYTTTESSKRRYSKGYAISIIPHVPAILEELAKI